MWLSRIEWNLVSRGSRSSAPHADRRETPREELDALALVDLAGRAGAFADLVRLDRAFELFAGRHEDVGIDELATLRRQANITDLADPDSPAKLRAAIGDGFQRTIAVHYVSPEASGELPAIATLVSARIFTDTPAHARLVDGAIPGRAQLGGPDVAYLLGLDHAEKYLKADEAKYGGLAAALRDARAQVAATPPAPSLYDSWIGALETLARPPAGVIPSFMKTDAFLDLRLDSIVAGYAQIRHDDVLLGAEPMPEGGCEIPDGYVDPVPDFYDALAAYADRGAAAMAELSPPAVAYFARVKRILSVLSVIARWEQSGAPLPPEATRFLAFVAEDFEAGYFTPEHMHGWYSDLFWGTGPVRVTNMLSAKEESMVVHETPNVYRPAALVADILTAPEMNAISYLGASEPHVGVFVVDTNGGRRVVVGPVAEAWDATGPIARRLTDADAETPRHHPWAASYSAAAPPVPDLQVNIYGGDTVAIETTRALGKATVELLDHHAHPIESRTQSLVTGRNEIPIDWIDGIEGVHIRIGSFQAWFDAEGMLQTGSFAPPPEPGDPGN
jgi:hypothetical protein